VFLVSGFIFRASGVGCRALGTGFGVGGAVFGLRVACIGFRVPERNEGCLGGGELVEEGFSFEPCRQLSA